MDDLTPDQKKQLDIWVNQRDTILAEVALARAECELLQLKNRDLAASNTEIADRIQQSFGRLEEMTLKEEEFNNLMRVDNAELNAEKSQLQSEITGLKIEIGLLKDSKNLLTENIETLTKAHVFVGNRVTELDKAVGEISQVSLSKAKEIENILINAGIELQKIISIGSVNVEKTNAVIQELPRIIFDLQRDILERKKFNKIKV